ncbi:MAG TPA: TRZ/ATZ family hydrolase [Usitatibacteraceae bacterium]|nr:TRZ/ATZ family hydrolase [Usitatibacteraceae bacterium]
MAKLIVPRWIIPVEPSGVVLRDHALVTEGTRIAAVMPLASALAAYPAAQRLELPRHILIPGLVNLHTHAAMTLMRGLADDTPLMPWLEEHIWPAEAKHLSEAYVHDGTLFSCAEMIRSGTTCFADMYFYHLAAAQAAASAGMRAALGAAIIEFPTPYASDAAGYIDRALSSRDELAASSRLKLMLAPHAPYTVADETFRRVATIAAEADYPVMVHLQETQDEVTRAVHQYGMRPIERLERLGMLTPNLVAVHCVHVLPEEIAMLANAGVHVAHCPVSNLKLASGIAPVAAMLEAGVNVGIGTDGAASNNRLDIIGEARLAGLLQKGTSGNAAALPAHQVLHMATLGGAKALGWDDEIGSLVAGKSADMTAIDLSALETRPVYDPVSHLFNAAGREQVSHVWVEGRMLLENRRLTTLDEAELAANAEVWQNRFAEHPL